MNRLLCCSLLLLGVAAFAAPAQAQVYYSTYYAPAYAPAMVAPQTVYYPNRVTSYYAPAMPVTSYMAPVAAPIPVTSYYAPTPVTSYYAPTVAPVTAYYAPTVPALAPVYVGRPAVVRSTVYYPGQPIRNTFRAFGP